MPIGTAGAIAIGLAVAAGFGAGWGLRPVPDTADVMAEQTAAIEALTAGSADLVEAASRPVVIDAEIRDALASTPPACGAAGDALSLECLVSQCWQYGQSSAQRPACLPFEVELVRQKAASCPSSQAAANATETDR